MIDTSTTAGYAVRIRRLSLRESSVNSRYFRGAKGDDGRYFRGAKGVDSRYFRGAKGDDGRYFRGAKGDDSVACLQHVPWRQ